MDPIGPARLRGQCGIVILIVLAAVACHSDERSTKPSEPHDAAVSRAPLSPSVLQIAPDQLSRIELLTKDEHSTTRRVVLDKRDDGWQIGSPIEYPANPTAMASMVAVMAEIEILTSAAGNDHTARKYWVDEARGVEVKAWAGDRLQTHFIVGRSTQEATYVQLAADTRILTVKGRCRPIFDKALDELRSPVITKFAVTEIDAVSYSNPFGVLELVADPAEPGKFVPKGTAIRNYNRNRASQQVGVLAQLFAKGFVDPAQDPGGTGLCDDDTARATLMVRGADGVRTVDVWVGTRTGNRLHVRTSGSEQIYLVSAHLETSLVARQSHLERSDEMMSQLKAHREKASRAKDGSATHTHGRSSAAPSQVSLELMSALRGLAREQRDGS